MTHDHPNAKTRQQIIEALLAIVGSQLTAARRAADMRMFHFRPLRAIGDGPIGDYALHVQCPWRIEGLSGIVTGRSDLWEPIDEESPFDENWDYEVSGNLQDTRVNEWLASHEPELIVESVEADEFGSVAINLRGGFVVRIFPGGSRGEDWRLLGPTMGASHFVVSGGVIEREES